MSANLFEKCEPISAVLAPYVQQMIISELEDSCDNLEYLCIGSVGKKKDEDFNGDIDIAIKCKDIEELKRIIYHTFGHLNIVISETLYIVSIEYPYIYDNEEKYVQCDFMVMWYTDYTAFRYFCPNYRNDESKYKVGAKIMLTSIILNHCIKEKNKDLLYDEIAKFDFRPTALYRFIYSNTRKAYKEEFVTANVNKIVEMCFYDNDRKHFNSVESLWGAIHSDNFKYPNEVKQIEMVWFVCCFRKGWTSIVPEDFKIEYWTNDQIWYNINQQKEINKINEFLQQGKEI